MKRILFFVAVTATLVMGCKKEKYEIDNNSRPTEQPASGQACTTTIVLSKKSIIAAEDYNAWKVYGDNKYLICNPNTSGDNINVDLNKMPSDDAYNTKKAVWLKKYGGYVNHVESRPLIVANHIIDPTLYTVKIISSIDSKPISELQNLVGMERSVFERDSYQKYLEVTYADNKMTYKYVNDFSIKTNLAYYSIPLLRSVMYNLDYNNDSIEFAFAEITDKKSHEIGRTIVMKVKGNIYYDYSDSPLKILSK